MFCKLASILCFALHVLCVLHMVAKKPNAVVEAFAYSPLIFLNAVFAMLLLSAGKQLYQKNF
jgi:hypothetical protein